MGIAKLILELGPLKLKLRVFLKYYSVAMATCYGIKMIKTCLAINRHLFDTIYESVVASIHQIISIKKQVACV